MVGLLARDLATGDLSYSNGVLKLALNAQDDIQHNMDLMERKVEDLWSTALAIKFARAAHSAWDKAVRAKDNAEKRIAAKAEKAERDAAKAKEKEAKAAAKAAESDQAAPEVVEAIKEALTAKPVELSTTSANPNGTKGTVKVGRWNYPAKNMGGQFFRNEKRDGSGEWLPLPSGKDFEPSND